jgi:hypothetical protein
MTKWKYINRLILDSAFMEGSLKEDEYLNEYGDNGWELCAVLPIRKGRRYYFKRQIT